MLVVVSGASYCIWLGKGCVKLQAASSILFAIPSGSVHWLFCLIDVDSDLQGYLLQLRPLALEKG